MLARGAARCSGIEVPRAVPAPDLRRGHAPLRQRQAGHALRPGAGRGHRVGARPPSCASSARRRRRAAWSRRCSFPTAGGCRARISTRCRRRSPPTAPRASPGRASTADGWQSPIAKFLTDEQRARHRAGDAAPSAGGMHPVPRRPGAKVVNDSLAHLRLKLGAQLGMIPGERQRAVVGDRLPALRLLARRRSARCRCTIRSRRRWTRTSTASSPTRTRCARKAYDVVLERHRARRRQHPYPPPGSAGARLPPARHERRGGARDVRLPARRAGLRRAAARRHRARPRSARHAAVRRRRRCATSSPSRRRSAPSA